MGSRVYGYKGVRDVLESFGVMWGEGMAPHMGFYESPISPLIANLFMEEFEVKTLSPPHPPTLWLRFVDDIYVIQNAEHSQLLLQHINVQDSSIQFTMEEPNQDGTLPFLDTQVLPDPNNTCIHYSLQETNKYRPISTMGH